MQIDFTKDELRILKFYMDKAKIDVEGGNAVGVVGKQTVKDVNTALNKIKAAYKVR